MCRLQLFKTWRVTIGPCDLARSKTLKLMSCILDFITNQKNRMLCYGKIYLRNAEGIYYLFIQSHSQN